MQWEHHGMDNQVWQIIPVGVDPQTFNAKMSQAKMVRWHPNPYQLYNLVPHMNDKFAIDLSNKDVTGWLSTNKNSNHAQFYIHEVPHKKDDKDVHVSITATTGERLRVLKGGKDNGVEVILRKTDKNAPQDVWRLSQHENFPGAFYIYNDNSGKCLDFVAGDCKEHQMLMQWEYHGMDNQIWHIVPVQGSGMMNPNHQGFSLGFNPQTGGFNQGFNQGW